MDRVKALPATGQPEPREQGEPGDRSSSTATGTSDPPGVSVPATVLVVEDEQIVALELKERLTRMGHLVVGIAVSGEEAIAESRRLHPDLILMDIKLQGEVDGIDAAAAIRQDLDAAIVYLTAFADQNTLERAKVTQPYGYILKPFQERELHVVIEVSLYRYQAERALRQSELWRLALLRSVGDAIIASDAAGRVTFMNPLAEVLTGWSESQARGIPLDEVFKTIRRPECGSGLWDDSEATFLISRDGLERPIEHELTPIDDVGAHEAAMGAVCVFRDISERRRVRDRQRFLAAASGGLSSSLDRELVLARATSLIADRWSDWCVIHLANKRGHLRVAACAHRDSSIHAALAGLVGAAVHDEAATDVEHVARTGEPVRVNDLADRDWAARALGLEAPVAAELLATAAIIVPLVARNQRLGTLTIVSGRRAQAFDRADVGLAEELARRISYAIDNALLYTEAQRATAMRDDVLAIVSHDLRNPLATISMGAEQLLRMPEKIEPHRVNKNATIIKRNAELSKRLIDDLLDVSHVDAGQLSIEPQRVSARSLVAEALSTFEQIAAEHSIRLASPRLLDAALLCDPSRVHQVLSNLLGNAVKFSPEGGVIRIDGELGGGFYQFSISDQGSGIAPDRLDHVFERYWQAPETSHRGSGLGLYIAKGIVEAHGGRIWVDSTRPHGSTFRFTIPLAPQREDALGAAP